MQHWDSEENPKRSGKIAYRVLEQYFLSLIMYAIRKGQGKVLLLSVSSVNSNPTENVPS